ncbi:MAG: hypothetical protein QM662_08550 [Gordonia sp. (in: high G+C Gram-positive bacteria)]
MTYADLVFGCATFGTLIGATIFAWLLPNDTDDDISEMPDDDDVDHIRIQKGEIR